MKKSLMTLGVLALFVLMAYGQEKKFALYSVAFYNMENLLIPFTMKVRMTTSIFLTVLISGIR